MHWKLLNDRALPGSVNAHVAMPVAMLVPKVVTVLVLVPYSLSLLCLHLAKPPSWKIEQSFRYNLSPQLQLQRAMVITWPYNYVALLG
jgi:hypothetical protein